MRVELMCAWSSVCSKSFVKCFFVSERRLTPVLQGQRELSPVSGLRGAREAAGTSAALSLLKCSYVNPE